jgi:hypothetical protein
MKAVLFGLIGIANFVCLASGGIAVVIPAVFFTALVITVACTKH